MASTSSLSSTTAAVAGGGGGEDGSCEAGLTTTVNITSTPLASDTEHSLDHEALAVGATDADDTDDDGDDDNGDDGDIGQRSGHDPDDGMVFK